MSIPYAVCFLIKTIIISTRYLIYYQNFILWNHIMFQIIEQISVKFCYYLYYLNRSTIINNSRDDKYWMLHM